MKKMPYKGLFRACSSRSSCCLLFRALEILVNHEPVNAETLLSGFL